MATDKRNKEAVRVLPGSNDVWDELLTWQEPANQAPTNQEPEPAPVAQTTRSAEISIEVHSIDPDDIEFEEESLEPQMRSSGSATSLDAGDLEFTADDDRHPAHQIEPPGKPGLARRQLMDPTFPGIPNLPDLDVPEPVPPNSGTDATSYAPEASHVALGSDDTALRFSRPAALSSSPLSLAERYSHSPHPSSSPVSSASSTPSRDPFASHETVRDRYALGDFSGALDVAEQLLEENPDDPEARRYARSCRDVLEKMYTAKLSPLHRNVSPLMTPTEARWLSLDNRAGFMLSLIDGRCSVEDVMDMSAMPRLDALRILYELLDRKIIEIV